MSGLAIIMFTGHAENFVPLAVLTQSAVSIGMPVRIFVTGTALLYFTKSKPEPRFSKEFEDFTSQLIENMHKLNIPSWYGMLKESKELGDVKIYVCSLMAEVMGIKKEHLDELVDDIVGATFFMKETEKMKTIFI